jgi:alkylated DNA repair dioxygenase AlkB
MTATIEQSPSDAIDAAALIDLARYPIDDPASARYREVVAEGRRALTSNGALALEGFISAAGLERLQAEAAALVAGSQYSAKEECAYGLQPDADVPEDHPYRIKRSSQRHCAAHHKMTGTALDALYRWPPVRRLVADLMAKPKLYLHEDPSNALVLMIYKTGDHLAWHFDRAQYSNIIELQASEAGGVFEFAPRLRQPDDECFEDVRAVLTGDRARVVQPRSKPGAFTMFEGQFALHQVTPVEGPTTRISLVLSYEEQPGVKLDVATRKFFFGDDAPDD